MINLDYPYRKKKTKMHLSIAQRYCNNTPYHHITCERHQFYLLVGDKLTSKKLLLVLECLKDRAFDSADCLSSCIIMPLAKSVVERCQRFIGPAYTI